MPEQRVGLEGLGDMAAHACFAAFLNLFRHSVCGQRDDFESVMPGIGQNESGGLVTIHNRHLQVHQNGIDPGWSIGQHDVYSLFSVLG